MLRNEKYRLLQVIMRDGRGTAQTGQKINQVAQEFKGMVRTKFHVPVSGNGIQGSDSDDGHQFPT